MISLFLRKIQAASLFSCLVVALCLNTVIDARATEDKAWSQHEEYRQILHHLEPDTHQIIIINRIADTISNFRKLHPDLYRKTREAARRTLAARKWNPVYAKQLMAMIRKNHKIITQDIFSDLYHLHKSLNQKQKNQLSMYLHERLSRIDKNVKKQINQARNYSGIIGTLFAGFGSVQRVQLNEMINAIDMTYNQNAATRKKITETVERIIKKKTISATDIELYLKVSREELQVYENNIISPVKNFLNSLDEQQKGRLVYMFDDASRQSHEVASK